VTWQSKIRAIPCGRDVGDSWGPSDDMLADIAVSEVTGNWDDQESCPPALAPQDLTDSDVSDILDEDSDDLFEGQDGDDSDGLGELVGPSLMDTLFIHSPKRVRV
jgi:hypothetical protein